MGQLYSFTLTVVAGVCVGLLFDMYRVFRSWVRPGRFIGGLLDVVYWVVVTPLVFVLLLVGNWGELRYYVFLGMALGLFAYFQLVSNFILWLCVNVYVVVAAVFRGVGRFVMQIFAWPVQTANRTVWKGWLATPRAGSPVRRGRPLRWRTWNWGRMFRP